MKGNGETEMKHHALLALCFAPLAYAEARVVDADTYEPEYTFGQGFEESGGDVVMDATISFTATDSVGVPTLPDDSKFALWLYGDAQGNTNLYVTAAGKDIADSINGRYEGTNYALNVSMTISGGTPYHVKVQAVKNIGPGMMGFVVLIGEVGSEMMEMATCADNDYCAKLPALNNLEAFAEYYIAEKALFPSMAFWGANDPSHTKAMRMKDIGFLGYGEVDDFNVYENDSVLKKMFCLQWGAGVAGFDLKVGDGGEFEPVDATDTGKYPEYRMFLGVAGDETIYVTNVVYVGEAPDSASHYEFDVSSSKKGTIILGCFEVDGVVYAKLSDAVSAGGEIQLLRDVEETVTGLLYVMTPFNLDLGGHTLTIHGSGALFNLSADVSLTNGTFTIDYGAAIFAFPAVGTPSATISGVVVNGTLVSGDKKNLSVVSGKFTDDAVKAYVVGGGLCSSEKDANGFYRVLESGSVKQNLSVALTALSLAKVVAGDDETVEVAAVPGFYYGVATGISPNALSVQDWVLATSDKVTLPIPRPAQRPKAAFYRIEAADQLF